MAYPYGQIPTSEYVDGVSPSDTNPQALISAAKLLRFANALNDLLAILGEDPAAEFADLTARLTALTSTLDAGVPLGGPASGELTGSYPNPSIAPAVITNAHIATGAAIQASKVDLPEDEVAGTPSLRSLGTGATQAAAGNDVRFATIGAQPGDHVRVGPKVATRWMGPPIMGRQSETGGPSPVGETATSPGNTIFGMTTGVTVYVPLELPAGLIDRLFCYIHAAGGAGGSLHMALYADADWLPTGNRLAFGSVDVAVASGSAGAAGAATVNYDHPGGRLWGAVLHPSGDPAGAPNLRGFTGGIRVPIIDNSGQPSTTAIQTFAMGTGTGQTALNDPVTVPTFGSGKNAPAFFVRYAS